MFIKGLVSIVTPAYNCDKYISQTIDSVINQTYPKWEMVIINDNSTDNTLSVIKKYAEIDQRIKIVSLNMNLGAANARNLGLSNALGQYIAFLDSDDLWMPKKLEKQTTFMSKNNYCFTYTAYECFSETKSTKLIKIPNSLTYKQSLCNTAIGCLTVMIDRNIVGDIRMPLVRVGQDHLTWWSILKKGHIAYGLNLNLAKYRQVKGSLSHNKLNSIKKQWIIYRKEEKLPFTFSIFCFFCYILNAFKKHYL